MDRQFFTQTSIESALTHLVEFIKINGTTETIISGRQGLLVDGEISNATIRTDDDSPIYISSLARLENVTIIGHEILMEGKAHGVSVYCSGRIEFGAGTEVVGVMFKGKDTQMYMHPLADLDDFTIKADRKPQTQVQSDTTPQAYQFGTSN